MCSLRFTHRCGPAEKTTLVRPEGVPEGRGRIQRPGTANGVRKQRQWAGAASEPAVGSWRAFCLGPRFPTPAFGSDLELSPNLKTALRSRSAHFPQGAMELASGKYRPLRKMTSAACGVGRDSITEALAERCPVRLSSHRLRFLEDSPVKKAIPGTRRPRGALVDCAVVVGFSVRKRRQWTATASDGSGRASDGAMASRPSPHPQC